MNADTVDMFVKLFRGRGDCYGSWDGGCVRERLTVDTFRQHLADGPHVGVYPAFPYDGQTVCIWGCTDIDYDIVDHPLAIKAALEVKGVTSWLERTRKGWHLWVFAHELVDAASMRRMFLAAHQVADVPAKEVNPKQEQLADRQVGNYVRLPYPGGLTERRIWVDGEPVELDWFVREASAKRATTDQIKTLASYWRPPQTSQQIISAPTQDMTEAAARLGYIGRAIFRNGPLPESDRSTTLLRLVVACHEAGLAREDCLLLLEDADLRWGKFMSRPNGHIELEKMILRVYGHSTSP